MKLVQRSAPRRAHAVVATVAVVLAAIALYQTVRDAPATTGNPAAPRTWKAAVGNHRLFIACRGSGAPAVILDAGLGDSHRVWEAVLADSPRLGVRVCAYDRKEDDLGNRPTVVIQGETERYLDPTPGFMDYWGPAQRGLAAHSTNSIFVIAAGSDHDIPFARPRLVTAAIGIVVHAARTGTRLPTCQASVLPAAGGAC